MTAFGKKNSRHFMNKELYFRKYCKKQMSFALILRAIVLRS